MAISKSTEASAAGNWPARRHNQRERKVIETVESFTPTTAGDWDTSPTTQDAALNELGSRVSDIEDEILSATVSVSNAEIQALNATPKTLIAAPGAGKLIVVQDVEFFHDFGTAAFDSITGNPTVEYATSGVDICTVPNDFLDNVLADATYFANCGLTAAIAAADVTASANKAVQLSNSNAIGVTGGATGTMKVRLTYKVVTLLA